MAQGSPLGSHGRGGSSREKQCPSPLRPAIPPPPRDLPLPSFPPALSPEVERRGAGLRALGGLLGSRPSSLSALGSPLLRGRADGLPGEQERPVRLAPALASLPPPPPAPPAPASAGSRSPPLGELRTRKQQQQQRSPHPGQEPRAARLQVLRSPATTATPSGPRGRGAPRAARPCGVGAGAYAVEGACTPTHPRGGSRLECSPIPAPGGRGWRCGSGWKLP